jgi:hypothetical protein
MRDPAVSRMRCGAVGGAETFRAHEVLELIDPAGVSAAVELPDEQHPGVVTLLSPGREERLEGALLGHRLGGQIRLGFVDEDVEVAHRAESRGDLAEAPAMAPRPVGTEPVPEDPPRGPHPAGGHPHRMEFLGVGALARPGLAGDHPREVEAEDLPAGFGHTVAGQHARRLPDDENLRLDRRLLLGRLADRLRRRRRWGGR